MRIGMNDENVAENLHRGKINVDKDVKKDWDENENENVNEDQNQIL